MKQFFSKIWNKIKTAVVGFFKKIGNGVKTLWGKLFKKKESN